MVSESRRRKYEFQDKTSSTRRRSSVVPRSTSSMNVLCYYYFYSPCLLYCRHFIPLHLQATDRHSVISNLSKKGLYRHYHPTLALPSKKHQHEEASKQRKPQNNKVAMKWFVESIEKILHQELKQKKRNMSQEDEEFLHLLYSMPRGTSYRFSLYHCNRTRIDVFLVNSKQEANRIEEQLLSLKTDSIYSHAIQERVMKAVSMAGYVNLSLSLLESMLDTNQSKVYVPSYMAYTAVLNRLRKWKRIDVMRELMQKLTKACDVRKVTLDIVALNTFISALCDVIPSSTSNHD